MSILTRGVKQGVFENGEDIAVKVLHNSISGLDGEEFRKEFQILRELKHQNVVELVGFCNEPEEVLVEHEGKQVVAIEMHRALCFEYVHNGSLHTYISGNYVGDLSPMYSIFHVLKMVIWITFLSTLIKGICVIFHCFSAEVYTGLNWHTRYKIIKGICEGLKYLRGGLKSSIWHLDLKPDNILLNNKMIPKIADFGLSRLLREEKTRKTLNCFGTR